MNYAWAVGCWAAGAWISGAWGDAGTGPGTTTQVALMIVPYENRAKVVDVEDSSTTVPPESRKITVQI